MDMIPAICAMIFGACIGFTVRSLYTRSNGATASRPFESLVKQVERERNWYFRDKEYQYLTVEWGNKGAGEMKQAEQSLNSAIYALKAGRYRHAYNCLMHANDMFDEAMKKYTDERTLSNLRNHRILSLAKQARELIGEQS